MKFIKNKKRNINITNLAIIIYCLLIISCFGPGVNDWKFELPNNYEIWRLNSNDIRIGLVDDSGTVLSIYLDSSIDKGLIGIPPKVIEFCYSSRYVCAKIIPTICSEYESNIIYQYYILDTINKKVLGTFMDLATFMDYFSNLSLQEIFSPWYSTKSPKYLGKGKVTFNEIELLSN